MLFAYQFAWAAALLISAASFREALAQIFR